MVVDNPIFDSEMEDIPIEVEELPPEEEVIEEEVIAESNFNENLAEKLELYQRNKISSLLMQGIKDDLSARESWEKTVARAMELMGLNPDKNNEDTLLSRVIDPLILRAFLNFMSNRYEMYPEDGIADYTIDGQDTEQITEASEKRVLWLNHYLSILDKDYQSDCDTSDAFVCMVGTGFKKVYRDPVTSLPVSRGIDPFNMILDGSAKTFKQCARITEVEYLTKNEVQDRINNGFYIKSEKSLEDIGDSLDEMDQSPINLIIRDINGVEDNYDKKTTFRYLTCNCILYDDFILEQEGQEGQGGLPYVAHICAQTNELVGLYRGWDENAKDYSRKDFYIIRKFIPGFGLYGIGFSHLLINPAIALTTMNRLLINAEKYNNMPGGFMAEGRRIEHPTQEPEPGDFTPISTMGMPISDVIMPFPYKGASPVLKELASEWRAQWQTIDMGIESKIAEQGMNAPVGTTMAIMESQAKLQSMIIKSLLVSLGEELRMIDSLFEESFTEKPFIFNTHNTQYELSKNDYFENVTIIPACSSDVSSSMHRIMINDAVMRTSQTAPELYETREVHRRWLKSIKVSDIDALLIPKEQTIPLDPLTENINALQGKALKVAEWQDHEAHMLVHSDMMQSPEVQQNPIAGKILSEHYMTHQAMKYFVEIKSKLGMPLPPLEQLQNPEIQNEIAQKLVPIMQERQKAAEQQKPMDPTAVMMADVQQRGEAAQLKAQLDQMKIEFEREKVQMQTELEAYKAQLQFEQSKEKIESEMEMAEEDNETKLTIEHLKQGEKND